MPKTLRPIYTNAGIAAFYRKQLLKELRAMQKSIGYWLKASYGQREDEFVPAAKDANPLSDILKRFRQNARKWMKRWNMLANWLARTVVEKTDKHTTGTMRDLFKAAGFTVKMDTKTLAKTRTKALIAENVNLIKKIPSQYLTEVEGIVTRGVSMGKDLGYIIQELKTRYDITERRAAMIARDQCDKATQAIQRTRDEECGITEGIWVHMPGQHTSRKTHIAMNGKQFKLFGPDAGLYDSDVDKKVLPGECVCCRCSYRKVIPEL